MDRIKLIGVILAFAALIVAILAWIFPFNPVRQSPFVTPQTNSPAEQSPNSVTQSHLPADDSPTSIVITAFCPFITQSQIEELKTIQSVDAALSKIREFSLDSKYWKAPSVPIIVRHLPRII